MLAVRGLIILAALLAVVLAAEPAAGLSIHVRSLLAGNVSLLVSVDVRVSGGHGVVSVRYSGVEAGCPGVPGGSRNGLIEAVVGGRVVVSLPAARLDPALALLVETGLLMHGGWRVYASYPVVNVTCRQGFIEVVYAVPRAARGSLHAVLRVGHGVLTYTYTGPPTGYEDVLARMARLYCGNATLSGGAAAPPLPELAVLLAPASPLQAVSYIHAYGSTACPQNSAARRTAPGALEPVASLLESLAQPGRATTRIGRRGAPAATSGSGGGGGGGWVTLLLLPGLGAAALLVMLRKKP